MPYAILDVAITSQTPLPSQVITPLPRPGKSWLGFIA